MITNPLAIATVIAAVTALAFWLERRVALLGKVGASLLVIIIGAVLSNLNIVTAHSPVYDAVTGPVTSLAIVWLLLAVHVGDLRRAGWPMLAAFGLGVVGTMIGAIVGAGVFHGTFGDETWRLAGTLTGTYTGGSLNFVAVGRGLGMPNQLFTGATAADALTTGLWLGACLMIPVWFGRFYRQPAAPEADGAEPVPHPFTATAPISTVQFALLIGLGFVLLMAANGLGHLVPAIPSVLWLTTLALIVAHLPGFRRMDGAMQLGNYALHLFFAVIGIYSRIADILAVGVAVFFFTSTVVLIHGIIVFVGGKLLKLDIGVLAVSSQANVGGPSTALAVAASREWPALVLPGVIVGLLGYALGNYLGFGVAYFARFLWGG